MAEGVEEGHEWSDWALDTAENSVMAVETLLATLRAFEDVLRQQEISITSSTEYCDNFCQALMHYAGSRNSMEHGLPLLEVYCLSINCFAAARSHLTAESDRVALVLKRLALSCFELLLSVPENEIPFEAWLQFHHSVQITHDTLLQYGSTDLQALLQITGEGGAWSNPVLTSLLTGQPTNPEEVNAYITLEGDGFMEMRVKHLEKMGEVAKAVVLAKACTECSFIPNQATFRQTYVSLLCHLLPNEEAIMEISRLDCKDVLEITCNLETEGEENTAFILCTTYLTQQLQQQSLYSSWELILLWSKLQKKLDPSLASLLERCLQLGAIAKTVQHLIYLVRVIQTEVETQGVPTSVELCVKALQLPKQEDSEMRTSVCRTVSCLLPNDLEVLRACQLTEFLFGPSQEAFTCLEELYLRPDQKYDQENEVIPNSLRCELLLALKAYWPFDPEFWDWKTLKYHCISLLGLEPESEEEYVEEAVIEKQEKAKQHELQGVAVKVESEHQNKINGGLNSADHQDDKLFANRTEINEENGTERPKFWCQICKRSITDIQIIHHSKKHIKENNHPCPVCLERFKSRKDLVPHMRKHIRNEIRLSQNVIRNNVAKLTDEDDDIEPGEIPVDPSLMMYYKCTHDPEVLNHIVQQTKTLKEKHADDDEHVTFDYMEKNFKLQNREEYPCPGTNCSRTFKHSKYLYVHLKSEHIGDDNVKHFHQLRDKREKCVFCRRHFISAYHHRKHRKVHYGDRPYICVVIGCGAQFKTSNELVTHKQTHGYQLNYQCELNGCYVTYSDLGQIYHHEAQHFRDAAFTCCSSECKKFYLSKKEFIRHLSTHKITFTEDDFEAQRKAKRKFFKPVREVATRPNRTVDSTGFVNGDDLNSQLVSCATSSQESDVKEPKATITLVAMCFDGSKFTCGFEKCGMTFSRARDVQRHLKCAHPDHLKLEDKEHKQDNEQDFVSKGIKTETEPEPEEKGKNEICASVLPAEPGKDKKVSANSKIKETNFLDLNTKCDALKELVIGLSKLSLNASPSNSLPVEPPQPTPDVNESRLSLHQAIIAKPPVVLLKKRPQLSEVKVKVQTEQTLVTSEEEGVESLATAKPYICKLKGCDFRSGQSYSLQRHYNTVHSYSIGEAKRLTPSFKPYKCQLCPKSHREKRVLKAHYINAHNISETLIPQIGYGSTQFEENKKPTSSTEQTSQTFTNHSPEVKTESSKQEHLHEAKNSSVISKNEQNIDNQSPSEEEGEGETESREEDEQKGQTKDQMTQKLRTRRLVAKSNLCYILDKFSKPFHCVAKNCDAAFSTQGGLVRHLQLVHHYNRSQLLLENDCDEQQCPEVKKDSSKKRPPPNLDEPQPQFKCHFANCTASYHLKSSLVRHTRDYHSRPPGLIKCKFDGCSKVFSHNDALKKHTLYSHCEYYNSLVVRLQSTHKKSVSGCQKKLIVTPESLQKEETSLPTSPKLDATRDQEETTQLEEKSDENLKEIKESRKDKSKRYSFSRFVFRSHEEALQMCQDRCMPVAYPCMVQNCDSVVIYMRSLQRHYFKVHGMHREDVAKNYNKLFFNAEQLEELIQKKSARPTVAEASSPKQIFKMECEAEPKNIEQSPSPMSNSSIKTETQEEAVYNLQNVPKKQEKSHNSYDVPETEGNSHSSQVSETKEDSQDLQNISNKEEKSHAPQKISKKNEDMHNLQNVSKEEENSPNPQKVSEKKEDSRALQNISKKEEKSHGPQKVSEKKEDMNDLQNVSMKEEKSHDPQKVSEKKEDMNDLQNFSMKEEKSHDPQKVSEKKEDMNDLQNFSMEEEKSHDLQKVSEKKEDMHDLQNVSKNEEKSHNHQEVSEKKEDRHKLQKISEKKVDSQGFQNFSNKEEKSHDPQKVSDKIEDRHDFQNVTKKQEKSHNPQKVSKKKEDSHNPQNISDKKEDSLGFQNISNKEEKSHDPQKVSKKKDSHNPQNVSEKKEDSHKLQNVSEREKSHDSQNVSVKEDGHDFQNVSKKEEEGVDPQRNSKKNEHGIELQKDSEKMEDGHDSQEVPEEEGNNHNPQKVPPKERELPPAERNDVLVAEELLPGEASTGGPTDDSSAAQQKTLKQEQKSNLEKFIPLLRPVTVDLSPPYSLRFISEESFQNTSSNKDNGKMVNGSVSLLSPVRQPLKRKNELAEQPLNVKETQPNTPPPCLFDIAAYKPIGFESSFLKFIQETSPKDKDAPLKRRDTFRRSCSVKENNQLGISHTRSRRTHSPLVKSRAVTGGFTSVQNLKSILDKALAGCGDLAIKQLQYLRPVVVLGRPVCTTSFSDLFPSETNSKLLLGS